MAIIIKKWSLKMTRRSEMQKKKIQLIVTGALVFFTVGGIFVNGKYGHIAPKVETSEKKEPLKHSEKKKSAKKDSDSQKIKETTTTEKEGTSLDDKKTASKTESSATANPIPEVSPETQVARDPSQESKKQEETSSESTPEEPQKSDSTKPVKPAPTPAPEVVEKPTVNLSIRGTTANSSAYLRTSQKVEIEEGESVMSVLTRFCKTNGIQIEVTFGGSYVAGINNLYEKDKGPESGWLYAVNGLFPGYGANSYPLKNGDQIEWKYTENLGQDVGAPQG
ncbi:hypothetical protein CKN81_09165 [Carnobacterium divergens]|nr:hypothetical protein CKN81_09165 [Carnobacterium divergens]